MKHFALMLALLYLYALLLPWLETHHRQKRAVVLQSTLFSLAAVVSMTLSLEIAAGQYGDSRSVIALVAGAIAGPVPAFTTAIVATLARSFYPLDGFLHGTVSVVLAALMGGLFNWFVQHRPLRLTIPQLMTFGVLFTLVKLATLLVFGPENRLAMFQVILVPAFLLYPAGFTSAFLLIRREKSLFERARQSAEHRRQFEVAIQSSPSGIMIYRDADHICVYANEMAASLLETTVDALVGSNIEAFITTVAPTRSEDQPVPYALPTGAERWLFVSSRHVAYESRDCQLVTFRDMTERKQAEAQRLALAVEQQKVRTLHDFLRSTSHDLRTPLAVINTSLYLAQKSPDKAHLTAQIHKAEEQVTHLSAMLDGIHDWVHLNYRESLALSPLCVNSLLVDLRERFDARLAEHQISLTLDLLPSLPLVKASMTELDAALQALLLNTLTYTPPGGKVWLRSYVDDACVCIEVADTGIGIAPEAAGRVFEPFYKADPARNVGDGGVGLGLAIVQRVVELHHGTVTLDSTPGRGSTFTIRLPASTPVLMPVTA